ncbi:putative monooxygenase p33MONOX isoform X2 [Latimeria chalumnae]|nr:PREDICTED: putative monooxygenase p33MONOX isoform X2 [Latimeria chalumnae]|eukprot:XP_005993435.1 PREDICTED: putative monooxygenase p33MONOX isoform X2 [Latimeria chalumnae]
MSLPIGIHRRAFSYDDALEDTSPMTPPPADMGSRVLWKQPVIPERKYQQLSKVEDGEKSMPPPMTPSSSNESVNKAPVVKAKATSIIMNSLMTKQTQESIQRFEQQAGLKAAGYTPHKGLPAEEIKYHRVAEALQKLNMQSGDERQTSSAQSTPSNTPQSSPKQKRRGWFGPGSTTSLPGAELSSSDSGVGDITNTERWSLFKPRTVQKSTTDPGGFTMQPYLGGPKPSPMELMKAQATRIAEDPANFKPPKMDAPIVEGKQPIRTHNLKPRDMNVLTPTGF